MTFQIVYITTPSEEMARDIGRALVEKRLAACANIVPGAKSIYHWDGKIVEDNEALLIVKSAAPLWNDLVKMVKSIHSYSVPCVVAWPLTMLEPEYQNWLSNQLQ